jgi:hypothetical protein
MTFASSNSYSRSLSTTAPNLTCIGSRIYPYSLRLPCCKRVLSRSSSVLPARSVLLAGDCAHRQPSARASFDGVDPL